MIRIAAVGDVHYGANSRGRLSDQFEMLRDQADLLLVAGDLTQSGSLEEANAFADDVVRSSIPTVVVLGNHDFHRDLQGEMIQLLRKKGLFALEGETAKFVIRGKSVGVAGLKGFGGGFFGGCVTEFGEPETKRFAHHCRIQAECLRRILKKLDTEYRFVLLHFSPIEGTLTGERRDIYPSLGSYMLAEAVDESGGVHCVLHGHAHHGIEKGYTPGGIPVRNVAQTVIRQAYRIYTF